MLLHLHAHAEWAVVGLHGGHDWFALRASAGNMTLADA
jgi:hypothetical protein